MPTQCQQAVKSNGSKACLTLHRAGCGRLAAPPRVAPFTCRSKGHVGHVPRQNTFVKGGNMSLAMMSKILKKTYNIIQVYSKCIAYVQLQSCMYV